MSAGDYRVRTMSRAELDVAVEWAAGEGWNPGLHDAGIFHAVDPEGFLMGFLDDEPVASISVVRYGGGFGFLGFYIVRPEHRGRGYGLELWKAGMRRLADCNVGLDGVVEQQPNYRESGFRYAWGNVRHEGVGGGTAPADVVDAGDVPAEWVLAYDAVRFPVPRAHFVARWIAAPGTRAFAVPGDGAVRGYAVLRPCRHGYKIGPLFADDEAVAESLFRAAAACAADSAIYLDTPLPNAAAVALAERHAMTPVFETARMYTGPEPDVALATVFGVTTFELG